jgi:outer membrane immunogenic protein
MKKRLFLGLLAVAVSALTAKGALVKRQLIAGFALGLLAVVPAMAADMKAAPVFTKAPMMPVYSWTGAYIGLNAGYAWGDAEAATTTVFSPTGYFTTTMVLAIAAAGAQNIKSNGFTGGGQIGYNWQTNSVMVVGLESDLEYFGLKGSSTSGVLFACCAPTPTIMQSVKTDWLATFRARLGYLVTPNALIYITGGGAVTDLKGSFNFTYPFGGANESASFSSTKLGWTVGGGVEWTLWSGWTAKAEYLFISFPSASVTSNNFTAFTPAIAFPSQTFTHSADQKANIARFGLNYKLGGMY